MTREGYQAERCRCGHVVGDHADSQARGLKVVVGVCLVKGCVCWKFRSQEERR